MLDLTKLPTAYGTNPTPQSTTPNTTQGSDQMWEPEQWGQAGGVYSGLAGGYTNPYTAMAGQMLGNFANAGGSPVDTQGWAAAQQPLMMQQYEDMTKQMMERAGMGGVRYGSGLQQSIGKYGGDLMNQFQSGMADRHLGAQENAMNRMYGLPGQFAGLGNTMLGSQLAGAEGLMGLGSQRAMLPLQVAAGMGGLGNQMSNQQMMPYQMMGGYMGSPQYTQQTYQPSPYTGMMGFGANLLANQIGSGGGGGLQPDMTGVGGYVGNSGQLQGW